MKPVPSAPQSDTADLAAYRRRRATADLYQRTLWGAQFCALGAVITAFVGDCFRGQPLLMTGVLLAFGLLAWARWRHRPPADLDDVAAAGRWAQRHWWMVLATSAVWCVFLGAVGVAEQRATTTFFVVAMVTVAFTSASAESLALHRGWALSVCSSCRRCWRWCGPCRGCAASPPCCWPSGSTSRCTSAGAPRSTTRR